MDIIKKSEPEKPLNLTVPKTDQPKDRKPFYKYKKWVSWPIEDESTCVLKVKKRDLCVKLVFLLE